VRGVCVRVFGTPRVRVCACQTHLNPPAQVREAQLSQYNYILVVGEAERNAQTVNVRTRDNVVHGMFALADVKQLLVEVRE
jgi:threonyl-tRNA synthetase